jgi:hypothetical protein
MSIIMKSKALPYLLLAFFSVLIMPAEVNEGSHHNVKNVKCFEFGCFGFLSKSLELDVRGDVYECSNGHRFVIRR